MDTIVIDALPFQPDVPALHRTLKVRAGHHSEREVDRLLDAARAIARPKAISRLCFIDDRGPESVVLDGVAFTSRVLRVNLDGLQRAFAFVCTAGRELAAWAAGQEDVLAQYYADAICEAVLYGARKAFVDRLKETHALAQTSEMHPGSLPDWPLSQQRPLFALLGDTRATIGVELTASYLMVPAKTVSGLLFPTEETFASCQLCPRNGCPNRRAPYDAALFEQKYARAGS